MSKERIYYNIQKYLIDRLLNHNEEYHYLARPYWVYVGDGLFCAKIPAYLCCLRKLQKCVFKPHLYFDMIHDRYLEYGGRVNGASILHRFYLLDYANKKEYNYTLENRYYKLFGDFQNEVSIVSDVSGHSFAIRYKDGTDIAVFF